MVNPLMVAIIALVIHCYAIDGTVLYPNYVTCIQPGNGITNSVSVLGRSVLLLLYKLATKSARVFSSSHEHAATLAGHRGGNTRECHAYKVIPMHLDSNPPS
jgi:hypothetical protein